MHMQWNATDQDNREREMLLVKWKSIVSFCFEMGIAQLHRRYFKNAVVDLLLNSIFLGLDLCPFVSGIWCHAGTRPTLETLCD